MKKVQSGDALKIPAATFNTFIDAARDFRSRQQGSHQTAQQRFRSSGIILVKNTSGYDRERFDILGIDGPIFTPTDDEEAFKNTAALAGVTPSESTHKGSFVVLMEPVAAGELASACVNGICIAKVDVADASYTCAEITDGDCTRLTASSRGSARILWAENGTGVKWAVVNLGAPKAAVSFPARITSVVASGEYEAIEQTVVASGTLGNKTDAETITIYNMAERCGPGSTSALKVNQVVMVTEVADEYWCDRPTNALYKD